MRSHVIVRNHVVEVSDDSEMDITPSPSPGQGATTNAQAPIGEGSTKAQAPVVKEGSTTGIFLHLSFIPLMMLYGVDLIEISSDTESSDDERGWPSFTDLVCISGKELSLGQQNIEVALVVRKALGYVLENLLFRNGFPCLATRAIWSRRSFIHASTYLETSLGDHVQDRYRQLTERLKSDATYVRLLSKLVCIHTCHVS